MKPGAPAKRLAILSASVLCVALTACEDDVPTNPESEASPTTSASDVAPSLAVESGSISTVEVSTLPGLNEVGSSQLVRTPNGVNFSLSTTDLEPGHAYTIWIVIFNDPDGCDGGPPCAEADIPNDDARPDMMYAGGHVVGGSGKASFAGRRSVGDLSGSANGPVDLPAYGLENPSDAEIWLVVHDHGPKLASYMPDMIQTIDGGCTDAGVPEAGASSPWNDHDEPGVGAFGERGPNTCASVQLAVHAP